MYVYDIYSGLPLFRLGAADAQKGDLFGTAMAVQGRLAICSAPFDDDFGKDSGSAYLFDVDTGAEISKLNASDASAWDRFGGAADITSDWAIVGSHANDDYGANTGAAYLFDTSSGQERYKLLASDAAPEKFFGSLVAVAGSRAVVGSLDAIYLFDADSGVELSRKPVSGQTGACDMTEDYIVVGNAWDSTLWHHAGAAYVFDTTNGSKLYTLSADDAVLEGYFGADVAVHGEIAVIGAYDWFDTRPNNGSVYIFNLRTGQQLRKIQAPEKFGAYGLAVALGESRFLVGDCKGERAYVYVRPMAFTESYCGPANLNSTGSSGNIVGTGYDAATCNSLTLVASNLPQHQLGFVLAGLDQTFIPFFAGSQGNLCLGGMIGRVTDELRNSGQAGSFTVGMNLQKMPPLAQPVEPGETWRFQVWYRDNNPGPTSNFTDGLAITFN